MNTLLRQPRNITFGATKRCVGDLSSHGVSSRVKYLPLLMFQLYLTGSVCAFAFGPLQWEVDNPLVLYSYVLLGQLFIFLGYRIGISSPPQGYNGWLSVKSLLKISIVVTLILLPPTLAARNFADLTAAEALADPSAAYRASLDAERDHKLLSITRGMLGSVLGLFLPLGVIFWRRMTFPWRVLWGIGVCGRFTVALYTGQAFGVFDIMLVLPCILWLSVKNIPARSAARERGSQKSISLARRISVTAVAVAVTILAFMYFSHSRQSRLGDNYPIESTGWSEDLYGISLPESAEFGVYYVTRYWALGYYGLSGCLDQRFEWTAGLGHSIFLTRYAGRLNSDLEWVETSTYPARLEAETGYRTDNYWHTIYPWLASDMTFPGALLFMGGMGFLLARAWSDSLLGQNPFAMGFLSQIMLLFYYIPANNLRMGNPEEAMTLWGLLALWLLTRKRIV